MAETHRDEQLFEADLTPIDRDEGARPGVHKTFRPYDQHQQFLIPPSLDDWLAEDHLARFVSDLVDEVIDLQPFYDSYKEVRGFPPYDPRLMLKILLYGYTTGTRSSRAIEKACWNDVAFRWLAVNTAPDFRSIARFRRRHLVALRELFRKSLLVCNEAGVVRLGIVALDGTKVRANASRRKAMSYRHLSEKEQILAAEVDDLLQTADGSFHYCYTAQAVVDEAHQVVVATTLSNRSADCPELPAMLDQVIANTGTVAKVLLADAGYFSADNVTAAIEANVDPYIATGRLRHGEEPLPAPRGRIPKGLSPKQRMARKLRTKRGRAAYKRRKAIVEPVFGQVEVCQGGKSLLLRGLKGAEAEWHLLLACHNFRKLFGFGGIGAIASA